MKKIYIILFFLPVIIMAQAPAIQWQKTFGGISYDRLGNAIQTIDGGYILSGQSFSGISGDKTEVNYGERDYWIVKTDANGTIQWQKDFGGNTSDERPKIIQTADGGYLVGGDSNSSLSGNKTENSNGFDDFWILKLDSLGTIEWQNTIGAAFTDLLTSIIQTPEGGYLLGGGSVSGISGDKTENNVGLPFGNPYYTFYDYWVVKLDTLGNIQWQNTIGSKETDYILFILNATDKGFLIGGYSKCDVSGDYTGVSIGDYDCWILKLDTLGNIVWQTTIGGALFEEVVAAINTNDGGYLLGMSSNSNISGNKTENVIGEQDYWVVKIDNQGNVIWDKTLGGLGTEYLGGLCQDNSNNFYVCGVSNSTISGNKTENSKGGYDYWVVKLDDTGIILWDKTIGGAENEINVNISYVVSDDSIIIGGSSLSSISGDKTENSRGLSDYWIVKLEPETLASATFTNPTVQIYPNPTTSSVTINFPQSQTNVAITVTNTLGQIVQQNQHKNTATINQEIIGAKGIYFVNITNQNHQKTTHKIIKQ